MTDPVHPCPRRVGAGCWKTHGDAWEPSDPKVSSVINLSPFLESAIIVDDEVPPANILSWDLGAGATQVISHAVVHSDDRVVIDDLEARRCARATGLAIIGSLGIVGRAKANGLIEQAGPIV